MGYFIKFFVISSFFLFNLFGNENYSLKKIENYKVRHDFIVYKNQSYTLLRSFEITKKRYFLVVDEATLKTKIIDENFFKNSVKTKKHKSRYFELLDKYKKAPFTLQNYGVKKIVSDNVFLSVDLCPSSKSGFEELFFKTLVQKNIPVTVFVSGKWIKHHQKEFQKLISFSKNLDITFGNHTFTHPFNAIAPLQRNFLLSSNIDVQKEILELEKLLLSYGITPSILFRYPGLISNEKLSLMVNDLGLIPVGAQAWLAKEEKPKKGDVILVHGNKNEPEGIKKIFEIIEAKEFSFGSILENLY